MTGRQESIARCGGPHYDDSRRGGPCRPRGDNVDPTTPPPGTDEPASPGRRAALRAAAVLPYALPGLLAGAGTAAHAQGAYPNRPIKVVIPVPAGSAFDAVIRPLGQRLQ